MWFRKVPGFWVPRFGKKGARVQGFSIADFGF
jgi:hypothetical protein